MGPCLLLCCQLSLGLSVPARSPSTGKFMLKNSAFKTSTAPLCGKPGPVPPGTRVSASRSLDLVLGCVGTAAAQVDTLGARAVTVLPPPARGGCWVSGCSERCRADGRRLPRVEGDAPRPTEVALKPTKAGPVGSLRDEPTSGGNRSPGWDPSVRAAKEVPGCGGATVCTAARGKAGSHEERCHQPASARSPRGKAPAGGHCGLLPARSRRRSGRCRARRSLVWPPKLTVWSPNP